MQAHVVIIEDEAEIARLIELYLKKEGLETTLCTSGEEGLGVLQQGGVDLLILDLNLPGIDGYEVLQKLREFEKLPVIIVSARTDDGDMILGFGYGADDFVAKPFSPKVLAARVRAHLRRQGRYSQDKKSHCIRFGEFTLDMEAFSLKKGAKRVALSPKEMELLIYLAKQPGVPVAQEKLYKEIWGSRYGDLTTISVHIQRLRKKIEVLPSKPRYIKTVHGFGYLFEKEKNS